MDGLPPLEESLVGRAVTDHLRKRRAAEGDRPTADNTRGRGSQAGQCTRRIAFDVLGVPRDIDDSDFNLITWQIGQDAHNRIQHGFRHHFHARTEVPISYRPDYDVSGNVDVVYDTHPLTGETRPNLIAGEIKSMSQFGFDIAVGNRVVGDQQPGPKREHVVQAAIYGGAPQLQAQYLHLVYYGKDKGSMAEWIFGVDDPLPHLDDITARDLANDELRRLTGIFERLDANKLPARIIPGYGPVDIPPAPGSRDKPWNCRYCPFQPTCALLPTGELAVGEALGMTGHDTPAAPPTASTEVRERRVALLEAVRALSTVRQEALRHGWPAGLPKLKQPDGWTNEGLDQVEAMVRVVEAIPDVNPVGAEADSIDGWQALSDEERADRKRRGHMPAELRAGSETREELRRRLTGLPDDLRRQAEGQAADAGVPHLDYVQQFSADDAERLGRVVEAAEEHHRARIARLQAACRTVGLDDTARHELVGEVTGGRTSTTKQVTGDEADRILARLAGQEVTPPDWRARCKTAGVTQAALLRHAKSIAAGLDVEAPKKIDRIPDELTAPLLAWLDDQAREKKASAA